MHDDYPRPLVMVDAALFTILDGALGVLLSRRPVEPAEGEWALPGGYVHVDEDRDLDAAVRRVVRGKVGFDAPYLEQLATFSGADRDPRGWSVSVVYYAVIPAQSLKSDLLAVAKPVDRLPRLPFDHDAMVQAAIARLRAKSTYSTLPAFLLPEQFTLAELHRVYEQTIGARIDIASFRTKILAQEMIEPVTGAMRTGAHRPAQLYRLVRRELGILERVIA